MKRMCDHYKRGDVVDVAGVQPHVVKHVSVREVVLMALPGSAVQVETKVSPEADAGADVDVDVVSKRKKRTTKKTF